MSPRSLSKLSTFASIVDIRPHVHICAAILLLIPAAWGCGGSSDNGNTCDVPALFAQSCAGSSCHSPGATQPVDLVSSGVENRVSNAAAPSCPGSTLADPSDPEGSLLYQKVADTHTCGAAMPLGGTPLSDADVECVRDWISGLLPPQGMADAGGDCPDCECFPVGLSETCYSGPDDTVNVGSCKAGTRVCAADNMTAIWGTCDGEFFPRNDNCNNTDDEDCDGVARGCSPRWANAFGSYEELGTSLRSVAMDSDGNTFFLGDFVGGVTFGGDRHHSMVAVEDKADIIFAKYDADGNYMWSQQFGDSSNQYASKIIVDGNGDVIIVLRAFGTVQFPGQEPLDGSGEYDIVVAKFDNDGTFVWSRLFDGPMGERSQRVAVDSENNVLLTGVFRDTVTFGKGDLTAEGVTDVFVVKLDGDGGAGIWDKHIVGTGSDDYGWGIATDAANNVYVTGYFNDKITLNGIEHTTAGNRDIFVAKFLADGTDDWGATFGGPNDDVPFDLAFDTSRNQVVITGYLSGSVNFGGGARSSNNGSNDLFLVKLASGNGSHVMSRLYGDENDQAAVSISDDENVWNTLKLDAAGNIYLAGYLSHSIDFGTTTLSANNATDPKNDVFFAKLDENGDEINVTNFGQTGTEYALDLAVSSDGGTIAIVGRFFGSQLEFVAFNVPTIKRTGDSKSDGFVVRAEL